MFTPTGFFAPQAAAGPITDGLVIYVDAGDTNSYPGTGTTWTDISPQAQTTFTLNGAPAHTSGDSGYFSFNGTDEYARDTQDAIYFTTDTPAIDIAFESVFRTDTLSGARALSTYWGGSGTLNQVYWFGLSPNDAGGIFIAVRESSTSGGASMFYFGPSIVSVSTWTHMVWNLSFNTVGSNGVMNCWINNTQVITDAALTVNDIKSSGAASRTNIARQESDASYFDGDIATIRLYDNKNLSTAEIQQNYDYFKSRGYNI